MSYAEIADVRAEGHDACEASDPRTQSALDDATSLIDRVTGRFFEARRLTFRKGWKNQPDLLLEMPIITIEEIRAVYLDDTLSDVFDPTDYAVFNRHVREGLLDRDDRENPKIGFQFASAQHALDEDFVLLERFLNARVQNLRLVGRFGYTQPVFTGARAIATNAADALTAPSTIKMLNGAFSVAGGDLGRTLIVAGSASNNGAKTIVEVVSGTTVRVAEAIVTEGSGFAGDVETFPQWGVTPREIRRACVLLAAAGLPRLAKRSTLDEMMASGRVRSMSTRDQSLTFSVDRRVESGDSLTGNPEADALLVPFVRPMRVAAA